MNRKKIFIFLVILSTLYSNIVCPNVYSGELSGKDKVMHGSVSCMIDVASYQFYKKNWSLNDGEAQIASFITTMLFGIIKEVIDDRFSFEDLAFDALGASAGAVINHQF